MKWYEIKKYNNYDNNIMKQDINFLKFNDFVKNNNINMNPDFQRGHVWTEEQQIAYVEYLLKNGNTARMFYFNTTDFKNIICVDGLQRFTAINNFINEDIKIFNQYYKDFYFEERNADSQIPMQQFIINIYMNTLKTKKEILEWYLAINTTGTPHSKEEIERVENMIKELER